MKLQTFGYLFFMTFIMVSTTMAAVPQNYTLKYLKNVNHGQIIHTLSVKATSLDQAIVVSKKQCVKDLIDRNLNDQDIVDLCNNPRL